MLSTILYKNNFLLPIWSRLFVIDVLTCLRITSRYLGILTYKSRMPSSNFNFRFVMKPQVSLS